MAGSVWSKGLRGNIRILVYQMSKIIQRRHSPLKIDAECSCRSVEIDSIDRHGPKEWDGGRYLKKGRNCRITVRSNEYHKIEGASQHLRRRGLEYYVRGALLQLIVGPAGSVYEYF